MTTVQESCLNVQRRTEDDGHTGSSAPVRNYLMAAVEMKPELKPDCTGKSMTQDTPEVAGVRNRSDRNSRKTASYGSQDALSSGTVDQSRATTRSGGVAIHGRVEGTTEHERRGSCLKAQLKQTFGADKGDRDPAEYQSQQKASLSQRLSSTCKSMFGSVKAMENEAQNFARSNPQQHKAGQQSVMRRLGLGKDELQGEDPHPEVNTEPTERNMRSPVTVTCKRQDHDAGGENSQAHHAQEKQVSPDKAHRTAVDSMAGHHTRSARKESSEHKTIAQRLGIGKDVMEGQDPHPEINEEKPTMAARGTSAWKLMFGNAKAMENQVGRPAGGHAGEAEQAGRADGKHGDQATFSQKPGLWDAEVDQLVRKPRAAEGTPTSHVEKLSPFMGPLDGDAAGALKAVPAKSTRPMAASSEVKAPSLWGRVKEEFEAVGETVKEAVVGKRNGDT